MSGKPPFEARILHVNDDEANRYAVTRMLVKAGFDVIEAATGKEALARLADNPDLIILDVKLPDIDGFEVARRIRANPATRLLPVLHLSANLVGVEARARGLESGADGYLTQPVEPAELVATVRSILRARKAESALRLQLEQNSIILQNIADAVTAQDGSGNVVYANDAALRILGYRTVEELAAGGGTADAFELLDEEGKPFDPAALPGRRVLAGEPEASAIVRWRRRGGSDGDRWTLVRSRPVRDDLGRVTLAINILNDFTDRRRSEQRVALLNDVGAALSSSLDYPSTLAKLLETLVPRLGEWAVLHMIEGDEVRWIGTHARPELATMIGELAQQPVPLARQDVLPDTLYDGEPRVTLFDDERLSRMQPGERQLFTMLGARASICVPLARGGRVLGALSVVSAFGRFDMADLALLEEIAGRSALAVENARIFRDAQAAAELRRDLVAVVAHDLKNPLNAIAMAAALLSKSAAAGSEGDRVRRQTQIVMRAADRMNRLIHDLLDISAIEAGRLDIERQPQRVGALVAEAIELLAPLALEKKLALDRRIAADVAEVAIAGDRDRLLQVFSNLVGNAIKFTDAGGRVTVTAERHDGCVRFAVADSGPGIAAEHLPHIFDRFWRVRGRRRDGTGLGLWIVKGLVEAHGGAVSVATRIGEGSTFSFTVPLAP